jgi:hypothetical protein
MPGAVIKNGVVLSRVIVSPNMKVEKSAQGGTNIMLVQP